VTHEVAGGRGVGGLREVQPGDELLMLASTAMKRQLLALRDVIKSASPSEVRESSSPFLLIAAQTYNTELQEEELVRLSLNWAVLLGIGREKSPHSYCFTVELLEPLRYLSCGKYALELFNTLGVRYIQVTSHPGSSVSCLVSPLVSSTRCLISSSPL
jgi:hypothetical protein